MMRHRGGNVLILVIVFTFLILMSLFSYWFLLASERRGTGNLVRRMQAAAIGEGVSAHLVSMVNRRSFEERFYRKTQDSPYEVTQLAFVNRGFPFYRSDGDYGTGQASFAGIIRDLNPYQRTYRIYVEVTYFGTEVAMSWDKRYPESLMGALNADLTLATKSLVHFGGGNTVMGSVLERIKERATDPVRLGFSPADARTLLVHDVSMQEVDVYRRRSDLAAEAVMKDPIVESILQGRLVEPPPTQEASTSLPKTWADASAIVDATKAAYTEATAALVKIIESLRKLDDEATRNRVKDAKDGIYAAQSQLTSLTTNARRTYSRFVREVGEDGAYEGVGDPPAAVKLANLKAEGDRLIAKVRQINDDIAATLAEAK